MARVCARACVSQCARAHARTHVPFVSQFLPSHGWSHTHRPLSPILPCPLQLAEDGAQPAASSIVQKKEQMRAACRCAGRVRSCPGGETMTTQRVHSLRSGSTRAAEAPARARAGHCRARQRHPTGWCPNEIVSSRHCACGGRRSRATRTYERHVRAYDNGARTYEYVPVAGGRAGILTRTLRMDPNQWKGGSCS